MDATHGTLTDRETDIMNVVWDLGSATAGEVREALKDSLAYNTVLTMLRILEEKGHLRHEEQGRAFRYYAVTARGAAKRSAVKHLVSQLFENSPASLVVELVSDRSMSADELRALRDLLETRLKEGES